ncbi:type II CAAX prenyl endopeptidase Rce1 family protein [Dyadobacter sp. CY356]|uniref:CPBP family glutamic-type intramembrane protease n=1 Tax=Dyadobacter sp. CY356 TaxID=2906442 RepID=UPI0038D4CB7B
MSLLVKVFLVIIFAPLMEECMFRLFLGFYRNKNYFKWLYYVSAVFFGCIHIFNYQFNSSHYIFIPFITISQTFGGLMLGYVRIIYGFWYGVLLHSLFNILEFIWQYIVDYDLFKL